MPHSGLSDSILTTQEIPPQNATTAQTGTGVNMQGWDGVRFTINLGVLTGSVVVDARVVESANANFSGAVNVANAAVTQIANTSPNNVAIIDVYRPTNQYVRCVVTPAVNGAFVSVQADRYKRGGVLPPTQAAIQHVKVVAN
jgi:hypothetical protein